MSDKLDGVHPQLALIVQRILNAMSILGHPMLVTDGVRTAEKQRALYAQGRTMPGRIVTNADGVNKPSNHQKHADGYGHAVDCAFLVNGAPSWDEHLPWVLYGEMGKALGCAWGGNFTTIRDLPHLEWMEP